MEQILKVEDRVDISTARRRAFTRALQRGSIGDPGIGLSCRLGVFEVQTRLGVKGQSQNNTKCLASMCFVANDRVDETTASTLTNGVISAYTKLVDELMNGCGGTKFINEALHNFPLSAPGSPSP